MLSRCWCKHWTIYKKTGNFGFTGKVIYFEPISDFYEKALTKSSGDPLLQVHKISLGASDGEVEINVNTRGSFSSIKNLTSYAYDRFGGLGIDKKEIVPLRRLDRYLSEVEATGNTKRFFLKMDTQGFDLEVFEGASGIMDRVVGLQAELAVTPLHVGMPD